MLTTYDSQSRNLSSIMKSFLSEIGIMFVSENDMDPHALKDLSFIEKYILLPDVNGIVCALNGAYMDVGIEKMCEIIRNSSSELRSEIQQVIEKYEDDIPDFFSHLPIFKIYGSTDYASSQQTKLTEEMFIPKEWNLGYPLLLTKQSFPENLQKKLNFYHWNFEDVIRCFLQRYSDVSFSDGQKKSLFVFITKLIGSQDTSDRFISDIKKCLYITSNGRWMKPSELYEESEELSILFFGEDHKFPDRCFDIISLKKLGLKLNMESVTSNDLQASLKFIPTLAKNCTLEKLLLKLEVILKTCLARNIDVTCFGSIKWIPVETSKPSYYPKSLKWIGSENNGETIQLKQPNEIYSPYYVRLAASACAIVHSSVSPLLEKCNVLSAPSIDVVLQHLNNVVDSYNDDEKGVYKETIIETYKFLAGCDTLEVAQKMNKFNVKVWVEKEFVEYNKILLTIASYDLIPYYYQPCEITMLLSNILEELGCGSKAELTLYIDVLEKIKVKHESATDFCVTDLQLSLTLVKFLAENIEQISAEEKLLINVPIDCNTVKLCKLKECSFHNFDEETVYSSQSDFNVLHRSLGEDVAQKLEIPDLVSLLLSDETSSLFESWGQHEPLTLRLNRLLKDYKDGLPIPKELIQNADDAGATQVYFLYDQRENEDLKHCLFDRKMIDWQGPALWVYNNALFQEEDFRNITKLNAGTKENDTSKIGKFGLGFNAVYHLTDVPSFLSGDNLVIFDPHTKYLGKALKNDMPGIRIRLRKSKSDFVKFNDQFKVFHDIFGAQLDFVSKKVEYFDGTLFRFPLRNSKTAEQSDINKFEYTDYEMRCLIERFEKSIGQLLLFTQNVKEVKMFILGKTKSEMKELFSVQKSVESISDVKGSIMQISNAELMKLRRNPFHIIPKIELIEKINMNVSQSEVVTWLASSNIGSQQLFKFAVENKGHNPCGGVAMKFHNVENKLVIDNIDCHIFCFLPLPERSYLPVSVNGAFEVTNDRKQLVRRTDDGKQCHFMNDWNDLLAKDIAQAYLNLLVVLKDSYHVGSFEDWIKVLPGLPLPESNSCALELAKSLMSKLIFEDHKLFPMFHDGGLLEWVKWQDIVIIPQNYSGCMLDDEIAYMNWFFKMEKIHKVCIEIPKTFMKLIEEVGFGAQLKKSILSEEEFFNMFFKYVEHIDLDKTTRSNIVLHILEKQPTSGHLENLLRTRPCIPTLPNGSLKLPSQLVKYDSRAGSVFDVEDEVFPFSGIFDDHLLYLESLGMENHSLRWENILNRAKSISDLAVDRGYERSELLIPFLHDSYSSCPNDIKLALLSTPFLIACKRPEDSMLTKWQSDGYDFGSPESMFDIKYMNIVSCSSLVCENALDNSLCNFLMLNRIPSIDVVKRQLIEVLSTYKIHEKITEELTDILNDVYNYLQQLCVKRDLKEFLGIDMIYTEHNSLVKPCQVFQDVSQQELVGYLHKLPSYLKRYANVFYELGMKSFCSANDYVVALKSISNDSKDREICDDLWKPIVHSVVPFLCREECKSVVEENDVYLPDKHCVMRNVKDMSFKDTIWFPDTMGNIYPHEEIPVRSCLDLGIKPLRNSFISQNSIGIPFGQHEELTTRIKNLLRGYSEKQDVLREILQNADDAGATVVEFILDCRYHKDEKVFSDRWKKMQGPALLVSNNGRFTKRDLAGIQSLGECSKSKEPLKTGRYGVGFNAVYHITDCPSFITKVEGQGDVLCIFDPNLLYAEGASKLFPGIMLENAITKLDNIFTDVKSAYLVDEGDFKNKTLFRLPLRNQDMAKHSDLTDVVTTIDDVKCMLNKLQEIASSLLLFLNNVKSLTFITINGNGSMKKEEFTAKPYGTNIEKFAKFRNFCEDFGSKLGNIKALQTLNEQIHYKMCMKETIGGKLVHATHWNVVEQCGFSNIKELHKSICIMIETNKLCLLPKGGIASLASETCCENCGTGKRKVKPRSQLATETLFCCLPIPVTTGLNVLVNGHFALDYETRRNLWSTVGQSVERVWNNTILTNCVLPCFITHLSNAAEEILKNEPSQQKIGIVKNNYYRLFPNVVGREDYWDLFGQKFYEFVHVHDLAIFVVYRPKMAHAGCELKFCSPSNFLCYSVEHNVGHTDLPPLEVLQHAHINIDIIPKTIKQNFSQSKFQLVVMSPHIIRAKLISMRYAITPGGMRLCVQDSVFQKEDNLLKVLTYCLQHKTGETIILEGLPLCILADGNLTVFTEVSPLYFSKFSSLLEHKKHMFVHPKLFYLMETNLDFKLFRCFKMFSLSEFSKFLPDVVPVTVYKNALYPIKLNESGTKHLSMKWLRILWEYIVSLKLGDFSNLYEINEWSLLIAKGKDANYLLPVKERKSVLFLTDQNHIYNEVLIGNLRKASVFEAAYVDIISPFSSFSVTRIENTLPVYPEDTAKMLFGSLDSPVNVIDSLLFSVDKSYFTALDSAGAEVILIHLYMRRTLITCDYQQRMNCLPLYEHINGDMKPVTGISTVVIYHSVPKEGLEELQCKHHHIFLKQNYQLQKLHDFLGFGNCVITKFYTSYFFPYMNQLPEDVIYAHMLFIRNKLWDDVFLKQVANQRFISTKDGSRKMSGEFYDRNKTLFQLMLDKDAFPPERYGDGKWFVFLQKLGLINQVSKDMFIKFATEINLKKYEGILHMLSPLLCEELFSQNELTDILFLNQVKSVPFLVPERITEELEVIYPSKNLTVKTICFENSATYEDINLIWTTKNVVPEYVRTAYTQSSCQRSWCDITSWLGMLRIKTEDVLENVKNITGRNMELRSSTCKVIPEAHRNTFSFILENVYDYLMKATDLDTHRENIQTLSFVLIDDSKQLDVPTKAVLLSDRILPPYLSLVPCRFGNYFEMLKLIGCTMTPTAIHYVNILKEIWSVAKDVLNPNEIVVVKKAVCFLSSLLKAEANELTNLQLYLPTVTFEHDQEISLTLSTDVIYMDDFSIERRLQHFRGHLLLPCYGEDLEGGRTANTNLMKYLPDIVKPKCLTEVVDEILKEPFECLNVGNDHISELVKSRLCSQEFLSGIERLVNHEKKRNPDTRSVDTDGILCAMKTVRVFVLDIITTQLSYKGAAISDSDERNVLFLKANDDCFDIYFSKSISPDMEHSIYSIIASRLLNSKLLNGTLNEKDSIILLPVLFETPLDEIQKMLDQRGISRDASSSSFLDHGRTPQPGDLVPLELYCLLNNDFVDFHEGEFVALQVGDDDDEPSFVCAIIRRCGDNPNVIQRLYGVQTTPDESKLLNLRVFDLYRFDRSYEHLAVDTESFVCETEAYSLQDFDGIIEDIRQLLESCDDVPAEQKEKVIRRLYLKWHPDRHPEKTKKLATKVFQFLQDLLKGHNHRTNFQKWNMRAERELGYYTNYCRNFQRYPCSGSRQGSSGGYYFPSTFEDKNPQPAEAKRWLRQAKYDLAASMYETNSHEWICFIAHQVRRMLLCLSRTHLIKMIL